MNATAPTLDIYSLPATEMLDTEQVGSLGIFGAKATLEHNRCLGKPGPKYLKISGRIFYRVSDLLGYLAVQEANSEREMQERRDRFERNARRVVESPAARQAAAIANTTHARDLAQIAADAVAPRRGRRAR